MLFFEQHFTKHHLLHAPHRWFLAFLVSPIHFLEMHYKKKYHLRFAHARKLFIFDMILLAGIVALTAITTVWFLYNPTVVDQIELTIKETNESQETFSDAMRVKSGEKMTYEINFKNNSASTLTRANLKIKLPVGFLQTEIVSPYQYNEITHTFALPHLDKNDAGSVKIKGWLYGVPHREEYLLVEFGFKQKGRDVEEIKSIALVSILRGSVLVGNLEMPDKIINYQAQKAVLTLQNNGKQALTSLRVPLTNQDVKIDWLHATKGQKKNNHWEVETLNPGEIAALTFNLTTGLENKQNKFTLALVPSIGFNNEQLPQETIAKTLQLIHPEIKITNSWQNNQTQIQPGETITLYSTLTNTGDSAIKNISLIIPIPNNIVDSKKIATMNKGIYSKGVNGNIGNTFIIKNSERADLSELKPGQAITIPIQIPLRASIETGVDIAFSLEPEAVGSLADIPELKIAYKNKTPALKIGTVLSVLAEARYYTEDGDQLGRGPLPPQVGKETKYGIILRVNNTTSGVEKINLTATLPPYVHWTGKTSVGRGNDIQYNSAQNSIQWSLNSLTAHDSVLLFFEVGLTPTESQRGTTPMLLQNIVISGWDSFVEKNLNATSPPVTSALGKDVRAKSKGVIVQ